jgi:hypothetical protein
MVDINHLQIRYKINSMIKHGISFDDILVDEEILSNWSDFIESKIGKIWLKSEQGQKFTVWNSQ